MMKTPKTFTILVVDDEEDFTEMLRLVLSLRGHQVMTARDGQEALDRISEKIPDLIILDVIMPGMGGVAFYDKVSMPNGRPLYPTIVCTVHENYKKFFTDLGVQGFVTKPFDMEKFLKTVDSVLSKGLLESAQGPGTEKERESQKKVMIVEDDPEIRDPLAVLFLDAGFAVSSASTCDRAVDIFFSGLPDLILIKQGLMGFPEFIIGNHVKQMPHTRLIHILVYSGTYQGIDVLTEEKLMGLFGPRNIAAYNDPRQLFEKARFILEKQKPKPGSL